MIERGTTKARVKLFSDSATANALPPFKHEDLKPRLCEVAGRDKSVVSGTDDDCVVSHKHCRLPISDCRLPIDERSHRIQREIGNWQLEIGNGSYVKSFNI